MTELEIAMRKRIEYIVHVERRPFCFFDFLNFNVDQSEHRMAHGTFRNKISNMIKAGEVEIAYHSTPTFYTLKGVKLPNAVTANHIRGVSR